MNTYFFSFSKNKQLIEIELHASRTTRIEDYFELPAWRPGRYQLQNFAKNILNFSVKTTAGVDLDWSKTARNTWKVFNPELQDFVIRYSYYANEFNAGGSYVSQNLKYFNPVNLTLFRKDELEQAVKVYINLDEGDLVACSMPYDNKGNEVELEPRNLTEWFDSPIIISPDLIHEEFQAENVPFHFWLYGNAGFFIPGLIDDLQKIAEYQIRLFGEFPQKSYHFFLLVPENTYYHGVEHASNTVMVLGQDGILPQTYYFDLLGLASHELFHAWNIARIRPAELLPYDYTRENYFSTCFVAEGFTTYYGDRILLESGVIDYAQYLHELETTLKRHFDEADHACQSLLESSFDLWVDGYEKGTPNKKVSVYNKGAVAAMILDILIRKNTGETKSLDDVMRQLWGQFGKDMSNGYTYKDIKTISEMVFGGSLEHYFKTVIESAVPIFDLTNDYLTYWSLKMEYIPETSAIRLVQI
jgi:predicted metalloprotease with PDZ domain